MCFKNKDRGLENCERYTALKQTQKAQVCKPWGMNLSAHNDWIKHLEGKKMKLLLGLDLIKIEPSTVGKEN